MPKPQSPTFLSTARAFYGPAFDHTKKKALARSMVDWTEMDEDEQSFASAHLAFLNLQAQAATQKLLTQVRDLLDEVAESLSVALEASLPEEGEDEEDEDEDDLVPGDVPEDELPPDVDDELPDEPDDEPDEDQAEEPAVPDAIDAGDEPDEEG